MRGSNDKTSILKLKNTLQLRQPLLQKRDKRVRLKQLLLTFFFSLLIFQNLPAQNDSLPVKHRIAVFAPLYLDSAFDFANNYRYEREFPKFLNPGLEFYEGVQLAIDSLNKEGLELEVFIYDTRSVVKPLTAQLKEAVDSSAELIIAHISGQELFKFARVAKEYQVPFINVNLPNDGGITNNPYFVMMS